MPAKPTKAMARRVMTIVAKLMYGAVPTKVNSVVEESSRKSYPFMATPKTTVSR